MYPSLTIITAINLVRCEDLAACDNPTTYTHFECTYYRISLTTRRFGTPATEAWRSFDLVIGSDLVIFPLQVFQNNNMHSHDFEAGYSHLLLCSLLRIVTSKSVVDINGIPCLFYRLPEFVLHMLKGRLVRFGVYSKLNTME